jgi:hypothetical protein
MPSYPASSPISLQPGGQIALVNNAATDANVTTTIQVHIQQTSPAPAALMLVNTTNQSATVQVAASDAAGNYASLVENGTVDTVAAGTAVTVNSGFQWILASFQTAPVSGSLILCR